MPKDFEEVIASVEGFAKPCIVAQWGDTWFLLNSFRQQYTGGYKLNVLDWKYLEWK